MCNTNEFKCLNGDCIPRSFVCDRYNYDCDDNSDENNCPPEKSERTENPKFQITQHGTRNFIPRQGPPTENPIFQITGPGTMTTKNGVTTMTMDGMTLVVPALDSG